MELLILGIVAAWAVAVGAVVREGKRTPRRPFGCCWSISGQLTGRKRSNFVPVQIT